MKIREQLKMNAVILLNQVIRPTLDYLGEQSIAVEEFLLACAAVAETVAESLDSISSAEGSSPTAEGSSEGLGPYRITVEHHRDVWENYLAERPDLASLVRGLASQHRFLQQPDAELSTNLAYSTAIAWVMLISAKYPLPQSNDCYALAVLWQRRFCKDPQCAATDFVNALNRCHRPKMAA